MAGNPSHTLNFRRPEDRYLTKAVVLMQRQHTLTLAFCVDRPEPSHEKRRRGYGKLNPTVPRELGSTRRELIRCSRVFPTPRLAKQAGGPPQILNSPRVRSKPRAPATSRLPPAR